MIQYPEDYQIYKPNAQGTGGALSLSFGNRGLFLKIARQLGTQRLFDWKPATVLALNLVDVGKILVGLKEKKETSLFHDAGQSQQAVVKTQKGLKITWSEEYKNYYWELWRKDGETQVKAGVPVTAEEAVILEELLKWTIPQLLCWQIADTTQDTGRNDQPQAQPQPSNFNRPAPTTPAAAPAVQKPAQPAQKEIGIEDVLAAFPGSEVVTEKTREEKLMEIMQLSKSKLGAKSAEEAKTKVVEATGLPFVDANIDQILSKLQAR